MESSDTRLEGTDHRSYVPVLTYSINIVTNGNN